MDTVLAYLREHGDAMLEYGILILPFGLILGWIVASAFGKGDAFMARIPRWMRPKGRSDGPIDHEDPSEGQRRSSPPSPPDSFEGGGGEFGGGGASDRW